MPPSPFFLRQSIDSRAGRVVPRLSQSDPMNAGIDAPVSVA